MMRLTAELTPPGSARVIYLGAVEIWNTGEGTPANGHYRAHVRNTRDFIERTASVGLVRRSGATSWDVVGRALRALGYNAIPSQEGSALCIFVQAAENLRAAINDGHKAEPMRRAVMAYDEARSVLHDVLESGCGAHP